MPQDEFLKEHYNALKTMVEVADLGHYSGDQFAEDKYQLAKAGLRILAQHNPVFEFTPPSESKIKDVIGFALEAFWYNVAEQLPQINSGDYDPLDQRAFESAAASAIRRWIRINSPR